MPRRKKFRSRQCSGASSTSTAAFKISEEPAALGQRCGPAGPMTTSHHLLAPADVGEPPGGSALLVYLRPARANLHLSLVESDLWELVRACGNNTHARVLRISSFCYPQAPGALPSSGVSMAFGLIEFSPANSSSGNALGGEFAQKFHEKVNGLDVPGLGSTAVAACDPHSMWATVQAVHAAAEEALAAGSGAPGRVPVYMARIELVNLFGCEEFNVAATILGDKNCNIHFILSKSATQVWISLKGIPANDAPVTERLHLSLHSHSQPHFLQAVDMVENLLQAVCSQFVRACVLRKTRVHANAGFVRHQYLGQRPQGSTDTSLDATENLQYLGPVEANNDGWISLVPPDLLIPTPAAQWTRPPSNSRPPAFSP